jgi:hypothetical protein
MRIVRSEREDIFHWNSLSAGPTRQQVGRTSSSSDIIIVTLCILLRCVLLSERGDTHIVEVIGIHTLS